MFLGCFKILGTVKCAAMNIEVKISFMQCYLNSRGKLSDEELL